MTDDEIAQLAGYHVTTHSQRIGIASLVVQAMAAELESRGISLFLPDFQKTIPASGMKAAGAAISQLLFECI